MPAPQVHRRDRGATMMIIALLLPVLILMTAFAVDLGRQRSSRRTMQARADIISLDLLRLADGRTESQIIAGDGTHLSGEVALVQSASRNDIERAKITLVDWGTWDPARVPKFQPTAAGGIPDAVKVTAEETTEFFFQPGSGDVSRTAIATQSKWAGFSIGSFAASLSSGGSSLLNPLIGDALNLGVLSYSGLATTNISYLGIAQEMGLLTPEDLFTSGVSARDVLIAQAAIMQRNNPSAAELVVLNQIINSPANDLDNVDIGEVVDVSAGSEEAALGSQVNLFDFLTAAAFISNGSSGLAIPSINLGVSGFNLGGSLNLIQAPATVFGGIGAHASTSQASATLTSTLGTLALGNFLASTLNGILPGVCALLLLGPLLCGITQRAVTAQLSTTVTVNLASAEGTIADIRCPGATKELDIDIDANLLSITISIVATLKAGATTLGTIPLSVTNTRPAVTNGTADFVIAPDVLNVFKPATPTVGSLTGTTTITGLGALGVLLTVPLNTLLNTAVTNINAQLVTPLAAALGARVASADVAARAIDCRGLSLVG